MVIINIDTSKDSKEEIKKTIAYLQSLVEEKEDFKNGLAEGFTNPFATEQEEGFQEETASQIETTSPAPTADLFGMFESDNSKSELNKNKSVDNHNAQISSTNNIKTRDAKKSAEDLLKGDFVEIESGEDEEVEIVDDQADAVVEIVEY